MTIRDEVVAGIAKLQARLAVIDRINEDTFTFGTVVVFSAATGSKWYYIKTGEELWLDMQNDIRGEQQLIEWILGAIDSEIGYFEVYVLDTRATPFFASA